MRSWFSIGAVAAALTLLFTPAGLDWLADVDQHPPHVAPPTAEVQLTGTAPPEASGAGYPGDVLAWVSEAARADWFEGVRREIEAVERAREAARRAAAPPRAVTVGDCTGFAIPDYIIARESGGNPSAYNPSGAYGCAQTLLSHYSSGSCRGLDPYTIEGQRECVNILSDGGRNLSPWAATR